MSVFSLCLYIISPLILFLITLSEDSGKGRKIFTGVLFLIFVVLTCRDVIKYGIIKPYSENRYDVEAMAKDLNLELQTRENKWLNEDVSPERFVIKHIYPFDHDRVEYEYVNIVPVITNKNVKGSETKEPENLFNEEDYRLSE